MVRVIGGRARGARLEVPRGQVVRPTTDRVREALFNVLAHRFEGPCDDALVLDLFAGAGTLGVEALSHGARSAVFVEANASVVAVLQRNAEKAGGAFRVVRSTVARFLRGVATAFDLVFMDPPYGDADIAPILEALVSEGWLAEGALICVETGSADDVPEVTGLDLAFSRTYGNSTISIYCP